MMRRVSEGGDDVVNEATVGHGERIGELLDVPTSEAR